MFLLFVLWGEKKNEFSEKRLSLPPQANRFFVYPNFAIFQIKPRFYIRFFFFYPSEISIGRVRILESYARYYYYSDCSIRVRAIHGVNSYIYIYITYNTRIWKKNKYFFFFEPKTDKLHWTYLTFRTNCRGYDVDIINQKKKKKYYILHIIPS